MPNALGGGDLDGDLYNLITLPSLYPPRVVTPGKYPEVKLKELPIGQRCTITDVADHIVDFILNDHLGRISIDNLIIADQSPRMSEDPDCLILAELASQAVDFAKSGVPADISRMPRYKFRQKPDWSAGEIARSPAPNLYPSTRALGVLYRAIDLDAVLPRSQVRRRYKSEHAEEDTLEELWSALEALEIDEDLLKDDITLVIRPQVETYITTALGVNAYGDEIRTTFHAFSTRLRFICANHTLSRNRPLEEEECWAGTIGAKSSQPRKRMDLQARMRTQTTELVDRVRTELSETDQLEDWLVKGWEAWRISCALGEVFGAKSFGWIALGSIFEVLKELRDRDRVW